MDKLQLDVINLQKEIIKMPFDEVLKYEMGKIGILGMNLEVLKSLVILKRSELMKRIRSSAYFANYEKNLVIDEASKLNEEEDRLVSEAILSTRGIVALSGEKAVDLYYTGCCGGGTANSEDVIGYRINYLRKILCKQCDAEYSENVIKIKDLAEKLNVANLSAKEEIKDILCNVKRDETGRIINICVMGKTISGDEFAKLVSSKSSRIYFQENSITVKSIGEGPGLGICLAGAENLAKQGFNFRDIIRYYYTGVEVIELDESAAFNTLKGRKILLDPGHGGSDKGNNIGDIYEKDVNLIIAEEVEKKLKATGVEVILTRKEDINVPSTNRVNLINSTRPDVFISIHQNNIMFQSINGVEVYCYENDSDAEKLGRYVGHYISEGIGTKNRGVKFGDYHLLRETKVSGIILECIYMSGNNDCKKYTSENYHLIADAIFKGICKFYDI